MYNKKISILKGIACLLVILNHFHGDGVYGDVVYCISHFGVPIFFLTSGFFLYNDKNTLAKLPRKIEHIIFLLLIHIGLYVLDFLFQRIIIMDNLIKKDIVIHDFVTYFSKASFKMTVLWSTSLFGSGQWFLIALLECYILFFIIYKFKINCIVEKFGLIISFLLFSFHVVIRLLLVRRGINQFFGINISESLFVRNVYFDALPFFLIGFQIRKNQEIIQKLFTKYTNVFLIISITSIILSICEMFFYKSIPCFCNVSFVLYLGTIVSCLTAFIWAVLNPNIKPGGWIEYIGKNLSLIVYFIHPIVIVYITHYVNKGIFSNQIILQLLVIFTTIILSYIIKKIIFFLEEKNFHFIDAFLLLCLWAYILIPSGTEWKLYGECYENSYNTKITKINPDLVSTVLITAQDLNGITIDAINIPVGQYINGGFCRNFFSGDSEYEYSLNYIAENEICIKMSDNIKQIRIWGL